MHVAAAAFFDARSGLGEPLMERLRDVGDALHPCGEFARRGVTIGGALGEAGKLVREVGGFTRFAPTAAGGTEARFFLPM